MLQKLGDFPEIWVRGDLWILKKTCNTFCSKNSSWAFHLKGNYQKIERIPPSPTLVVALYYLYNITGSYWLDDWWPNFKYCHFKTHHKFKEKILFQIHLVNWHTCHWLRGRLIGPLHNKTPHLLTCIWTNKRAISPDWLSDELNKNVL